jgi:hypothetical protein
MCFKAILSDVWTLIGVGANIVPLDKINKALVKINDPN